MRYYVHCINEWVDAGPSNLRYRASKGIFIIIIITVLIVNVLAAFNYSSMSVIPQIIFERRLICKKKGLKCY